MYINSQVEKSGCVVCAVKAMVTSSRVARLFTFFVANTFQIQQFHKGLAIQADVAFCLIYARSIALTIIISVPDDLQTENSNLDIFWKA
jgi:hypothetical protein